MPLLRDQLGQALRRARKQRGLTLRDVSAAACISISHISTAERGVKEMSSEFLESYLQVLEIPLSRILQDATVFAYTAEHPVPDTPAELVVGGIRPAAAIAVTVAREGVDEEIDAGVYN